MKIPKSVSKHPSRSGYVVELDGQLGRTYHDEPLKATKVLMYMDSGEKLLVHFSKLKIVGFVD